MVGKFWLHDLLSPCPTPESYHVNMLYYMNIRDFVDVIKAANQLELIWGDYFGLFQWACCKHMCS